jgi:hypothetical protein
MLSFQHSKNIKILKNNHVEAQMDAQNNKRQYLCMNQNQFDEH